ncbi:putative protein kinase RLK-Pelle-CrRLK1L-1 family [Helianthus annuus]|uniref:Protein kinase domain-containing protein n=1 Tax=Helianthus annuus TaxID=4232 RepID=A0A9K3GZC3_HELAN|nr:putative protein kinase RLK-Pelle-CrRLK1L-1 family [Helianthus annuus]KAJ0444444.1 putative protein kinase RLK-Pelle-CrRLK1L-1 family [Helianthus annuus]KAJ0461725.1 putative protein kinase RLK-Pelle-CrRLK1L-1 family [Helianthus annuus]KAJ0642128.1 putative protein kinase RLK-Pelle-CrRLK1L-1 family [Helianthus annuus]KAJ0646009.1 putative protein kinase RLK-Pelle-CrRLK1L-1 family [Helianthus annuus]
MDAFLQQFQHLKIQLEEITSATNNFHNENYIGGGGFGKVYKGEMSHSKGRSMVAIKRLDRRHGQGIPEFLKEITALSRYSHENLISLLGFCYQGDEMILVYDHASRGSLDRYLNSPHLTWSQRLKICLDAAKGLRYLHNPRGTHQRLIHCDVKSANILLDEQWNGKLADFGLSIMGPANEQQSVIVTMAAGTLGYCDPQYAMTHTLTKESDVYSFGVVLFEVLCGRLCCTYSNDRVQQNLVRTWIECYEEKKLNDIIFKDTAILPLEQSALGIFSDIAYRCLKESREDRPRMAEVVIELATALQYQKGNVNVTVNGHPIPSSQHVDQGNVNVTVNGHPIPDRLVKKAEKLAGPVRPGDYWYDPGAGFWGMMGCPCRGIIPPFIEEFNYPMPEKCADGNTNVFVNGRELHQKDLDLLVRRGLPADADRSYVIEISGRVLDEESGLELEGLGKLAPSVERKKQGFGMKPPRTTDV